MVSICGINSHLLRPQYIVLMYCHFLFIGASPLGDLRRYS